MASDFADATAVFVYLLPAGLKSVRVFVALIISYFIASIISYYIATRAPPLSMRRVPNTRCNYSLTTAAATNAVRLLTNNIPISIRPLNAQDAAAVTGAHVRQMPR